METDFIEPNSNFIYKKKCSISLHEAIKLEDSEQALQILEQDSNAVNEVDEIGYQPLHYCVVQNKINLANLLLKYGAKTEVKEKRFGMTPLHLAVKHKNIALIKILLNNGAAVNAVTKHDATALHIALENQDEAAVRLLIDYKANIAAKKFGKTSLHIVCESKSTNLAKLLLDRGALVNDICNDYSTALHVALEMNDSEMLKLLLERGAKLNVKKFGMSPFCLAVKYNSYAMAKLLLESSKNSDDIDNLRNKCVALHLAFQKKAKEMVRIFIEYGVDPNCKRMDKFPLLLATEYEWEDIVILLLSKGAKVDEVNNDNNICALHVALAKKNERIIMILISKGANVNIQQKRSGLTPLHLAISNDFVNITKIFLAKGANINSASNINITPLHIAFEKKNKDMVLLLLNCGANSNVEKYGKSPLQIAIECKWLDVVRILLKKGANPNTFTDSNLSLLCAAIKQKSIEIVESLLDFGADINIKNKDFGLSPLHYSAQTRCDDITKLLLARGVKVNQTSMDGRTALDVALGKRDEKTVMLLLNYGADNSSSRSNVIPLHIAADSMWLEVSKLLLERGANPNEVICYNYTPLYYAVQREDVRIVKLLIQYGADVNIRQNGLTLLHQAVTSQNYDIVQLLLDSGANINAFNDVDTELITALHIALSKSDEKIAKLLLDRKIHCKVKDRQLGRTPLHLAALYNCEEVVKILLKLGAKVNDQDKAFKTPVHLASMRNRTKIVELFLEYGADLSLKTKSDQFTPLHYAVKNKCLNVIELLLQAGANMGDNDERLCSTSPLSYAIRTGKNSSVVELMLEYIKWTKKSEEILLKYLNDFQQRGSISEALLKVLAKFHHSTNFETSDKTIPQPFISYYKECFQEINNMKNDFVYGGLTVYNILTKTIKKLSYLVSDESASEAFHKSDYKSKYRIYGNILLKNINKAREMHVTDIKSKIALTIILQKSFPDIIKENILKYLSNSDLKVMCHLHDELTDL